VLLCKGNGCGEVLYSLVSGRGRLRKIVQGTWNEANAELGWTARA
jgi:hypothetical protein